MIGNSDLEFLICHLRNEKSGAGYDSSARLVPLLGLVPFVITPYFSTNLTTCTQYFLNQGFSVLSNVLCVSFFLGNVWSNLKDVYSHTLYRTLLATVIPRACIWLCLPCRRLLNWEPSYDADTMSANKLQPEQNDSWILSRSQKGRDGCNCIQFVARRVEITFTTTDCLEAANSQAEED